MRDLQQWFEDDFLPNIDAPPPWAQALNVSGEAGEFVEAYRRLTGYARRSGSISEVMTELADVVISAYGFATLLRAQIGGKLNLDEFIEAKIDTIMNRGFGAQAKRDNNG